MSNFKLLDDRISDALHRVQGGDSAFEVIYKTHGCWPLPASSGKVAGSALIPLVIIPMLWGLSMARKQKWLLCGVFSLGAYVVSA